MDSPLATASLSCPQCGGQLQADQAQIFLTCPYCSSTVYLDKSQVVFHWYLSPTLDEDKARASLARWMAGNQTVKNLDKKAQLMSRSFEYFPLWYFRYRLSNSAEEQILLEPAAATSISELRYLKLPAGDLRKYEDALDAHAHPPNVPLQAAQNWVAERHNRQGEVVEQALVHVPLYTFKYSYQGIVYTAIVEGGTGGVFANLYPAKAEAPYLLAGGLTALVFLCLSTFPLIGALTERASGVGIGLLACSGLGILAAPALFALAAWVAAKI